MVEYITYNKEKLPIRIKYYALMKFKAETGKSFDEMQALAKKAKDEKDEKASEKIIESLGLDEFQIMEPLLYYSMVSGHKAISPEKEFKFKRSDAFDILEECFVEFANLLPKFFPDEEVKETGADDDGKKSVGNRQQKRKSQKKKK